MKVLENEGVHEGCHCGGEEEKPAQKCFRLQAGGERSQPWPACARLGYKARCIECLHPACRHTSPLCHIF